MSVFQTHFNKEVNQFSPWTGDEKRVVKIGADGEELVTYEPVDFEALALANGTVEMWSLDSLLKAGINPDFKISTGFGTRLEGEVAIGSAVEKLDSVVDVEGSAAPESGE